MRRYNYSVVILFFYLLIDNYAQTVTIKDTFLVNQNNHYKISSLNIIPFSEKVYVNKKLIDRNFYQISYETGVFSLKDPKLNLLDTIIISYKSLLINLKKEYKIRNLVTVFDSLSKDSVRVSRPMRNILSTESIFGKNIQKNGAIIRGFTIGTNQDLKLNSGLKLQMSGKLSDDIEIIAALSDENTPIQPEGNTETLQELDKVFIELHHKNATGTFGDFDLIEKQSEFIQLSKKLQGLKGEFNYKKSKSAFVIANSRGKFNTMQFYGKDGNQGPYRLYGINNERAIIIIAGSEKVYLNGELMKRGENNDYIIDYSNAEITFTPRRIITSFTRISIDFEYTDQNYSRNFFGASLSSQIVNDKINLAINYFREGDNETNPVALTLSDDDINILKNSGDNRNSAIRSGVTLAKQDSTGKVNGYYTRIDTVINSQNFSYYIYLPGKESSIYNVTFSYVGNGKGDYVKESIGNYKFVGIGKGDYLPVIFLPLPELKQIGNISLSAEIINGFKISTEFSGSSWDKNRFSSIDDNDNLSYARNFLFEIEPKNIKVGKLSLGKIGFSFKDRYIQNKYTSLDRINPVEFNRYYNLPESSSENQLLREIGFVILPLKQMSINSNYGFLKYGDNFISDRYFNEIKLSDNTKYNFNYKLDYVKSKESGNSTLWNRQSSTNYYSFGNITPGLEFLYENKEIKFNDSLLINSYKYGELIPSLGFSTSYFDIKYSYSYREEFFPLNNYLKKQSTANLSQINIEFKKLKEFSTTFNFTFRKKYYTDEFIKLGYSNSETILLLSQSRFNLLQNFFYGDFYYQAATEQTARQEKVFLKVSKGSGNYIYLGDLNNNGIPEENEFEPTSYDGEYILVTVPTEQLFPVIDLKSYLRWTIEFDKIIKNENSFYSFLKNISTETFYRIEENNKTNQIWDIYLMRLSKFLDDSTTIRGSQLFQQDLNILKYNSKLSFRLRFLQRKSLNQFSGGLERGFFKERSIRIRFRPFKEINNQTDYVNQIDNLISNTYSNRRRKITRNELSTDFSYRPINIIEAGLKIIISRSKDEYPETPSLIDVNSILFRINYSIKNFGRIRFEAERTEMISNSRTSEIPFEITKGNVIGKNYFLRAFFDYRIGSNVQTSLTYDARLLGKNKMIHTMRAEARAFF
ncbi:hypothetical protein [Rosettibacter firmus]|uniref:hypothetical protein n=1 Tax=Rosettibacter firmus TaxID=3111522 RepID=UPI00336C217F